MSTNAELWIQYNLGTHFERLGKIEEALKRYKLAEAAAIVDLGVSTPAVAFKIGLCLEKLGELEDALIHYRRALQLAKELHTVPLLFTIERSIKRLETQLTPS